MQQRGSNSQPKCTFPSCRIEDDELDLLMLIFGDFWLAEDKQENTAATRPTACHPSVETAACPSRVPADTASAKGQLRPATSSEVAADGSSNSAEARAASQQGYDEAADVAAGATSKDLAEQGGNALLPCLHVSTLAACHRESPGSHVPTSMLGYRGFFLATLI